jgi:calreticulin
VCAQVPPSSAKNNQLRTGVALSEVLFQEEFKDSSWGDRWIKSKHDSSKLGDWTYTAGKFYNDAEADKGIQTSQDARFYAISSKLAKSFNNENKDLVIQFQVKHEQKIDCGGGYIKVYPSTVDQADLHGDSPYNIMFGPDICGYSTKKVHVIFTYNGKNLLTKKTIACKDDELSHVYTLLVKPDNTYEVYIDLEKKESGRLEDDWDFLLPRKIKDPVAKKPEDWDEREKIDDPEETKPADFDKPQHIPDPDAKKPEDWDDDIDGEWEPPMIDNPDYQGEWKPKQIDNPEYDGKWVHPEIDNPDFVADDFLYRYTDIGAVGFDLWQVKAGSIFDNVFVGDSLEEAKAFAEATYGASKDGEKAMQEKLAEEERKRQEELDKARAAEEEDNEEEEDEEALRDEL